MFSKCMIKLKNNDQYKPLQTLKNATKNDLGAEGREFESHRPDQYMKGRQ